MLADLVLKLSVLYFCFSKRGGKKAPPSKKKRGGGMDFQRQAYSFYQSQTPGFQDCYVV
jgi:hypothetical protein